MAIRETTVCSGRVRGVACGNPQVTSFKGIPYAQPPVGTLRWKPPVAVKRWDDTFEAVRFGNLCPQILPEKGTFYHKEFFSLEQQETQSEDCLQLNIWTSAQTCSDALPVLVFIHGGGFQTNYSFAPQFDGENLAARGLVVVSINYRLGIFGFLAHPELTAESPLGRSGNYGLLDQIFALNWVRNNIGAFGGDPEKVTISGGSAGAASALLLSVSPLATGLFQRAIIQSCPLMEDLPTMEQVESDGRAYLERLGYHSIAEARTADADALKEFAPDLDRGDRMFLQPCIDRYLLQDTPLNCFKRGEQANIDYMVGCCQDEALSMRNRFNATPKSIETMLQSCYGEFSAEYRANVRCETAEDAWNFQIQHGVTEEMYVHCLALCELQNRQGNRPPFFYHFERKLPGDDCGAFHACEHWYVFETLQHCWRDFSGDDYELSKKVARHWVNFIRCGDPNDDSAPKWRPYDHNRPQYMTLDINCHMSDAKIDPAAAVRLKYHLGKSSGL